MNDLTLSHDILYILTLNILPIVDIKIVSFQSIKHQPVKLRTARMIKRFALILGVFFLSQTAFADIYSANQALARGDARTAAEEFKRLAKIGDSRAQAHLAYMYYIGEGVTQSYTEAVYWYEKAAVQGNRDAQYNLAVAYAFGEGVEQDLVKASTWYRRAADQGHIVAQYSLGISYIYGEGVNQDIVQAFEWVKKSAEQGYSRAQVHLGSMYHTGEGVLQNFTEAANWYRKAADRGDATAQYNLANLYRSGKGVDQDYLQALRWYRAAAEQGYKLALNEIAVLERTAGADVARRARSTPVKPEGSSANTRLQNTNVAPTTTATTPAPQATEQVAAETITPETSVNIATNQPQSEPVKEEVVEEVVETKTPEPIQEKVEEVQETVAVVEPETIETPIAEVEDTSEVIKDEEVAETKEEEKSGGAFSAIANWFKGDDKEKEAEIAETMQEIDEAKPEDNEAPTPDVAVRKPIKLTPTTGYLSVPTNDWSSDKDAAIVEESTEVIVSNTEEVETPVIQEIQAAEDATFTEEIQTLEEPKEEPAQVSDVDTGVEEKNTGTISEAEQKEIDNAIAENTVEEVQTVEEVKNDIVTNTPPASTNDLIAMQFSQAKPLVPEEEVSAVAEEDLKAIDDVEVEPEQIIEPLETVKEEIEMIEKTVDVEAVETIETEATEEPITVLKAPENVEQDIAEPIIETKAIAVETLEEETKEATEDKEESGNPFLNLTKIFSGKKEVVAPEEADPSEELYPASEASVNAGQAALAQEDYDKAYKHFKPLALNGDAEAQSQLAGMYYLGKGKDKDLDAAFKWHKAAAENGNANSQYSVGNMYLLGESVTQDYQQASNWYKKAADQGHQASQYNYNNLQRILLTDATQTASETTTTATEEKQESKGLLKSIGSIFSSDEKEVKEEVETVTTVDEPEVVIDPLEGKEYILPGDELALSADDFKSATNGANSGDTAAQYKLGQHHYQIKNYRMAKVWYQRAATQGLSDAQFSLGNLYLYGLGVEQDEAQARNWFSRAASQGNSDAENNLALLNAGRKAILPSKDRVIALDLEATDSGEAIPVVSNESTPSLTTPIQALDNVEFKSERAVLKFPAQIKEEEEVAIDPSGKADYEQGLAYVYGNTVESDPNQAFNWFLKSAEKGYAPAQYKVGVAYAYGDGTPRNYEQALRWYKNAALQGHNIAQRNIGNMYYNGQGVNQDKTTAYAWYKIVADNGNEMDKRRLDNIKQELSSDELNKSIQLAQDIKSQAQ